MGYFNSQILTNQGLELLAAATAGTKVIFDTVKAGSGTYTAKEIAKLPGATDLKDSKQSFPISAIEQESEQIRLRAVISNQGLSAGYDIRELGVFAKKEDGDSVLVAISIYTDDKPTYLPPFENTPVEMALSNVLAYSGNGTFDILYSSDAYVPLDAYTETIKELQKTDADLNTAISNANTKLDAHAETIKNLQKTDSDLNTAISNADTKLDAHAETIKELQKTDADLNTAISNAATKLDAHAETIKELQKTDADLNTAISNAETKIDTHKHSNLTTEEDNREVPTTPNDYRNVLAFKGIKTNTALGFTNEGYSYLFGLRGWSDSSGGNAHELAFNDSGIYHRAGSTTEWGAWEKIADTTVATATADGLMSAKQFANLRDLINTNVSTMGAKLPSSYGRILRLSSPINGTGNDAYALGVDTNGSLFTYFGNNGAKNAAWHTISGEWRKITSAAFSSSTPTLAVSSVDFSKYNEIMLELTVTNNSSANNVLDVSNGVIVPVKNTVFGNPNTYASPYRSRAVWIGGGGSSGLSACIKMSRSGIVFATPPTYNGASLYASYGGTLALYAR